MRWLMRLLDRKPRPEVILDAQEYRRALHKASDAVPPDDPRMKRVLREFDMAEERLWRHG